MTIKEVYMKNFGKFQKKRISFQPGINIVYGENESGKTTLYTFLQGIFFGIPRKRGTASKTDTYTRCLPWENPSWYEGSVLFEEGGKDFRLERNFDSRSREAELYCVTDGEKMSVEEGDLDILLGGATQRIYENTAAIGQQKSRTQEGLREDVEEYLANFQTEGDFLLDPQAALSRLKEQRKERELREKLEESRESLSDIAQTGEKEIKQEGKQDPKASESFPIFPALVLLMAFAAAGFCVLFLDISWMLLALPLLLGAVLFLWYLRDRRGKEPQSSQEEQERVMKEERRRGRRMSWQESLNDKETLLYNLQEELEELENDNEEILKARKEARSLVLAEKMLAKAAGSLQSRRGNFLKDRTWEILEELTQGRYRSGLIDENFQIRLDGGDRYVGLYQVSQGTVEQVYFALRMAAGELLCREEELPVLLDETFAMYDDRRLCQALRWLQKHKSQVILFTCTRREIQMLQKLGIPWNQISL